MDRKLLTTIDSLMDVIGISENISEMFLAAMEYSRANPLILEEGEELDQLIEHLNECWEIDLEEKENKEIALLLIYPSIHKLDSKVYEENPYYKTIKFKGIKEGKYELINDYYLPYEIFSSDDIKVDENYFEHCQIGYFDKSFPFLALNKDKVTWMNITPNEINTMQKAIDMVQGDVLVFGLGLGYFPFMASLKENVKSITIVEKDKEIISLFNKHLLPQFPHKAKIKVIEGDALKVAPSEINKYDYCFIDLWHNPVDGLPFYKHFETLHKQIKTTKFLYWLEDSFSVYLRRLVVSILYDEIHSPGFRYDNSEEGKLLNSLKRKIDFSSLHSPQDIEKIISDKSLKELLIS